jgi:drug/metabolite transporter (DMT)-like permease
VPHLRDFQLPPAVCCDADGDVFYATLYIAARESVRNPSVPQVAFRALLVAALMLPGSFAPAIVPYTERIGLHALRAAFLYGATLTWVYALAHMPIADVTAINFASPLFTVIFTLLFLGEAVGSQRWVALLLGFAGVLLICGRELSRSASRHCRHWPLPPPLCRRPCHRPRPGQNRESQRWCFISRAPPHSTGSCAA